MADRSTQAAVFLDHAGWGAATRKPLAGDASNRRYERLTDPATGKTAVLMDAPTERGEDIRPFCSIASHLHRNGFSAPELLCQDPENGFLLLEDLGDNLFARIVVSDPQLEPDIYAAATDVLVHLGQVPLPDLARYDAPLMTDLATLAFTKYRKAIEGDDGGSNRDAFQTAFCQLLERSTDGPHVLVMRDYHSENLIWLPDRAGIARVGLLDFQDAMAGHPAYDLVSLLQDVRRDVSDDIEAAMTDRYLAGSGTDPHQFRTAYAVLGAQRHLRVLGVFARLCTEYGKPHYVDFIPKVWASLLKAMDHPALTPVAPIVLGTVPEPTAANLQKLRDQCRAPLTR